VDELSEIGQRFHELVDLARANSIVMDRFTGTGVLSAQQAREIGVLGVVARASGLNRDSRVLHPFVQLPAAFHPVQRESGDVLARFEVRCDEVDASLRMVADFVSREGPLVVDAGSEILERAGHGTGIVEGWRGAIVHRVEFGSEGRLRRVKIVDPSFFAWPALPVALIDTIVPDFPLVNKSFNLSYAGNDL
jgi:Ni,Fe-hydrogenase III large subunit